MSKVELVLRDGTRIQGSGEVGRMSFPRIYMDPDTDPADIASGEWFTKKLKGAVIVMDGETVYTADNPAALPWLTKWSE